MNNTSLNITINSVDELYKVHDMIINILPKFRYDNVSVSGKIKMNSYSMGEDYNDIAQLKLSLSRNPNINFDLSITGKMFNNFIGNYISIIFIRNISYGNRFDVACTSDNPDNLLKFVEAVEKEYTKMSASIASPKVNIPQTKTDIKKYDVFVSHASADKQSFVNELEAELRAVTTDVWYDRNKIKWGDSIKGKIYEGLEQCEFGIVVFSKSYVGREWTEKELKELLEKQNTSKQNVILPIFLNDIPEEELRVQYPFLGDILYIKQSEYDVKDIVIMFAERLIERLKSKQ